MTADPSGTRVRITTGPFWRLRLAREASRYALLALSVAGLAASARFAIAPPSPSAGRAPLSAYSQPDRAAEGYAVLFARRYLSWSSGEPAANARSLDGFVGQGMEGAAGMVPPPSGEQHVLWAEVVQAREPSPGEHVYTVAAQTDTEGLLYLTVGVSRTSDGLAITGYPAFVGAPASGPARTDGRLREVTDPLLATVVTRALRNYLAGSAGELAADLTDRAHVALPGLALTLETIDHLDWARDGRSVVAVVQAQDGRGTQYTLAYELDVVPVQGRWEVSAVQMDPYD